MQFQTKGASVGGHTASGEMRYSYVFRCAVTGMKVDRSDLGCNNANTRGQKMVQGTLQIRAWNGGIKGKDATCPSAWTPVSVRPDPGEEPSPR